MESKKSHGEDTTTQRAEKPAEEKGAGAEQRLPVIGAGPQPPQPPRGDATPEHKCKDHQAKINNWIQGIGVVVLVFYTVFAGVQASLMKESVDHEANQFAISSRPWATLVEPIKVVAPLKFNRDGAQMKVDFWARNGGTSPAISTTIHYDLEIGTADVIIKGVKTDPLFVCSKDMVKHYSVELGIGLLIFPQIPVEFGEFPLKADAKDFYIRGSSTEASAFVVGSVQYMDQLGEPHCTSFFQMYVTSKGEGAFPPVGTVDGNLVAFGIAKAY